MRCLYTGDYSRAPDRHMPVADVPPVKLDVGELGRGEEERSRRRDGGRRTRLYTGDYGHATDRHMLVADVYCQPSLTLVKAGWEG